MTVKELIKALQELDQDTEIEISDSYTRNEGWESEDIPNASSEIQGIRLHRGRYIIEDEEIYL